MIRPPRVVGERMIGVDELYFSNLVYERVQSTKVEFLFTFSELRAHACSHAVAVLEVIEPERRLIFRFCDTVRTFSTQIRQMGALLVCIDVVAGFATVAAEPGYEHTEMLSHHDDDKFCCEIVDIVNVRQAVVEQMSPLTRNFVANPLCIGLVDDNRAINVDFDTNKDQQKPQLPLLCSPNAAAKKFALRNIGLIVTITQAG